MIASMSIFMRCCARSLGGGKTEATLLEVVPDKCITEAGVQLKEWRP